MPQNTSSATFYGRRRRQMKKRANGTKIRENAIFFSVCAVVFLSRVRFLPPLSPGGSCQPARDCHYLEVSPSARFLEPHRSAVEVSFTSTADHRPLMLWSGEQQCAERHWCTGARVPNVLAFPAHPCFHLRRRLRPLTRQGDSLPATVVSSCVMLG